MIMSVFLQLNNHKLLTYLIASLDNKDLWKLISLNKFIHDMIYRYYYWFKFDDSFQHVRNDNYIPCLSNGVGTVLQKYMKPIEFIKELQITTPHPNNSIIFHSCPLELLTSIDITLNYINSNIGWGVFANDIIASNRLLFPYYGEFIRTKEVKERQLLYDSEGLNYVLTMKEHIESANKDLGEVQVLISNVDASYKGNIARYVNHSCNPNMYVKMIRQSIDSIVGIPVFKSLRVIAPGEQLTIDYGYIEIKQQHTQQSQQSITSHNNHQSTSTLLSKRKSYEDNENISKDHCILENRFRQCECGSANCKQILPYK